MVMNRDQIAVCADYAKSSVTTVQVANMLGLNVNRHNRCSCPFHNGKDRNMSLKNGMFHCFVCGEHGDIFSLIQGVTGMPFIDSLKWVNSAFALGMNIDSPVDEKRLKRAKNCLKRKEEQRAFAEWLERMDYDLYLLMDSVLIKLEEQRDRNRPKRYGEEWSKEFCDAVELIPVVKEHIDYYLTQCTVVKP